MAKQEKAKVTKLEKGTVYQKVPGGLFYFRYQINGQRKAVALKTKNHEEALQKAREMLPVIQANNVEIVAAHVQLARGFVKKKIQLSLASAWGEYSKSPERATPATVSEQLAYETTFNEFLDWLGKNHLSVHNITEISDLIAVGFSNHLKTTHIGVDTHNRKIKRIRKVFSVLKEYYSGDNPFSSRTLLRNEREERETMVQRQSFSREQIQQLKEVLMDPKYKVMNKPEIRVIYYLGIFCGRCLKDCVMLQWQNIDMEKRRIWVKQYKTGKEVTIPMSDELYQVLLEAKEWRSNQFVCPASAARYSRTDDRGKNIGNNLVNLDVLRAIRWIGVEPSVTVPGRDKKVTVYGFHSLRHSFASFCAEAGVPKAVLLSILGTDSEIADKYYTHIGDKAQQDAISAITREFSQSTPQERIAKALALLKGASPSKKLLEKLRAILEDEC